MSESLFCVYKQFVYAARGGCSRKFRTTGTRTMLAGECSLCGAPISKWASRLEDGAPATHVRYAVEVQRR